MERVIKRDSYLNQLVSKKENGLIKVIKRKRFGSVIYCTSKYSTLETGN